MQTPIKQYSGEKFIPPATQEELRIALIEEQDQKNIQTILNLLNTNIKKKEAIRASKLSELQDTVQEQISRRLTERGDNFSNKDLLEYFKTLDQMIDKTAGISAQENGSTAIQLNSQQFNINLDKPTMSREEREQVSNAVQQILQKAKQNASAMYTDVVDGEYTNVEN